MCIFNLPAAFIFKQCTSVVSTTYKHSHSARKYVNMSASSFLIEQGRYKDKERTEGSSDLANLIGLAYWRGTSEDETYYEGRRGEGEEDVTAEGFTRFDVHSST